MTATVNPQAPLQALASNVRVNLLPREVLVARKARTARLVAVVGLAVVVLLLAGVTVLFRAQVGLAGDDLAAAQDQTAAMKAQERAYADVVTMQAQVAAIGGQVASATADDLAWQPVFDAVRAAVPSRAVLTGITADNGVLDASASAGGAAPAAPAGGAPGVATAGGSATPTTPGAATAGADVVGTLQLTGAADSEATVAAYVDALSAIPGLTAVVASDVHSADGAGYGFTINASLTKVLVGSRWSKTPGGK